jgi:SLT domain-containing protein
MSLIVGIIIKYRKDIEGAFEAVWAGLVDTWNNTGGALISTIAHAWDVVSASVSAEWDKIAGDLSQIWGELVTLWNDTGGKLVKLIDDNWSLITRITQAVWNLWSGIIKAEWDFIWSYISSVVGTIVDIISIAWSAISGEATIAWDLISSVIKGAWDLISGIVAAALDLIWGTLIKPAWDTILAFFEVTWDLIKGIFNTALDAIKGALQVFIDIVTGNWSKAWQDIQTTCQTVTRDIFDTILSVFNDIWHWLSSVMTSIVNGVVGAWEDIWNGIRGFLGDIWGGIKSAFSAGLSALGSMWNGLKQLAADPVNFVIDTVYDNGIRKLWNSVSGLFGGPQAKYVTPLAFATGGIVPGSGTGDTVPALLTPGEYVLSTQMIAQAGGHGAIEAMFGAGKNDGYHYGGGGGVLGAIWGGITSVGDAIKNVALGGVRDAAEAAFKPINALLGSIPDSGTGMGRMMVSGVKGLEASLLAFFGKKDQSASVGAPGNVSGNLVQWLTTAIKDTGVPMSWLNGLEVIAMHESSGNPNAQNNWDSNAAAGDPSRGLMQTIMSTFMAYHQAGTSTNIFDPVANAASAINYIKARYGSINNVPGIESMAHGGPYVGYSQGTWDTGPYSQLALLHPHEAVLPAGVLGGPAGSGLGGGTTVIFDFRNGQYMSNQDMDLLFQKASQQFVQKVLPQAGVQVHR